jgi:arylsulfatase A-like enzyme
VRTIDVAPTLVEALGLPALPGRREGVSLLAGLRGGPFPELSAYSESGMKWGRTQHPRELRYTFPSSQGFRYTEQGLVVRRAFHREIVEGKHRALRRGRFKVARHPTEDGPTWNLRDETDREAGDRKEAHPEEFAALKAELETYLADLDPARLEAGVGGEPRPPKLPWWLAWTAGDLPRVNGASGSRSSPAASAIPRVAVP